MKGATWKNQLLDPTIWRAFNSQDSTTNSVCHLISHSSHHPWESSSAVRWVRWEAEQGLLEKRPSALCLCWYPSIWTSLTWAEGRSFKLGMRLNFDGLNWTRCFNPLKWPGSYKISPICHQGKEKANEFVNLKSVGRKIQWFLDCINQVWPISNKPIKFTLQYICEE